MADINITPYIDILLVLLIIFMVITPVPQNDLEVKVPQPNKVEAPIVDPNVIIVSIGESAAVVSINQEPTTMAELGMRLEEIYKTRDNKNMFINASAKLAYGDIVKVIDIAKGAGVGDIGLLSEEIE